MTAPILRDFPFQFETERLLIRGPLPGDGQPVRDAVIESQPELKQWLPWAVDIPSATEYEVIVRQGQLKFLAREDMWLLLFLKESGRFVGGSGLHRPNWAVPSFEIGYWVRTSLVGRGYITEAVNGITRFAFDTLAARRVEIQCDSRNVRSAAVARRCGYDLEGPLRQDGRHHLDNSLRDTLIFAKIQPDLPAA
mgnify:CR=1 FL=1